MVLFVVNLNIITNYYFITRRSNYKGDALEKRCTGSNRSSVGIRSARIGLDRRIGGARIAPSCYVSWALLATPKKTLEEAPEDLEEPELEAPEEAPEEAPKAEPTLVDLMENLEVIGLNTFLNASDRPNMRGGRRGTKFSTKNPMERDATEGASEGCSPQPPSSIGVSDVGNGKSRVQQPARN